MKKLIISILLLLFLSSCVTGYYPHSGSITGGYSEIQLGDNIYQVTFVGNGYTSSSLVEQRLLRRCADLTIERGYKYFFFENAYLDSFSQFSTINGQLSQINRHSKTAKIRMYKYQTKTKDLLDAKLILKQLEPIKGTK